MLCLVIYGCYKLKAARKKKVPSTYLRLRLKHIISFLLQYILDTTGYDTITGKISDADIKEEYKLSKKEVSTFLPHETKQLVT